MLHECHATHVSLVFGAQNSMVTIIFEFGLRIGQCQVKLGQIRSNFQIQNFLAKICLNYPVLSRFFYGAIYFHVWKLKVPKIAFQKGNAITFTCFFFAIAQPKMKILL